MTEQERQVLEDQCCALAGIIDRMEQRQSHGELHGYIVELREIQQHLNTLFAASKIGATTNTSDAIEETLNLPIARAVCKRLADEDKGVRCPKCGRRYDLDDKKLTIHKPGCPLAPTIRVGPPKYTCKEPADRPVPVEPILPGEYLSDELEARRWTLVDAASRSGQVHRGLLTVEHLRQLIAGKARITPAVSHAIAEMLDQGDGLLWMRLQESYDRIRCGRGESHPYHRKQPCRQRKESAEAEKARGDS